MSVKCITFSKEEKRVFLGVLFYDLEIGRIDMEIPANSLTSEEVAETLKRFAPGLQFVFEQRSD